MKHFSFYVAALFFAMLALQPLFAQQEDAYAFETESDFTEEFSDEMFSYEEFSGDGFLYDNSFTDTALESNAEEVLPEEAVAETFPAGEAEATPAKKEKKSKKSGFVETAPEKTGNKFIDFFNKGQPALSRHLEGRRVFEIAVLVDVSAANTIFGVTDVLSEKSKYRKNDTFVMDLTQFGKGIGKGGAYFGAKIDNSYIGFDFSSPTKRNKETGEVIRMGGTGFGLHFAVDGGIDFNIPKSFFTFMNEGNSEQHNQSGTFSISGAVFAEISFNTRWNFMNQKRPLRVKITPAYFLPVVYIPQSGISYDFQAENSVRFAVNGAFEVYSAFALNTGGVDFSGGIGDVDSGGVDISVSAEYPLTPIVDVGIEIEHIPVVPSKLTHVLRGDVNGILIDADNLLLGGVDIGSVNLNTTSESGVKKLVIRPVRMDFYALWRPLRTDLITLRPSAGITFLTPSKKAFFNGILGFELNCGRIFFFRISTGLEEGLWRHKIGFDFNFRAFELDLGIALASQNYVQSYKANGVTANLAVKFGW